MWVQGRPSQVQLLDIRGAPTPVTIPVVQGVSSASRHGGGPAATLHISHVKPPARPTTPVRLGLRCSRVNELLAGALDRIADQDQPPPLRTRP